MCIGLLFPLLVLLLSTSSNLSLSRSKHWGIWHSQVEGGDSSSKEGWQCWWAKGVAQRQWDHLLQMWQSQIAVQLNMAKCISTGPVKSLCIVSIMQRWMSHICDISVTFNSYMWQGLYPVLTVRIQSMYSILLNEKHIKGSFFGSRECLPSERVRFWQEDAFGSCADVWGMSPSVALEVGGWGWLWGGHRVSSSGFPAYWSKVEPFIATATDLY